MEAKARLLSVAVVEGMWSKDEQGFYNFPGDTSEARLKEDNQATGDNDSGAA